MVELLTGRYGAAGSILSWEKSRPSAWDKAAGIKGKEGMGTG
jgi:hypothetical protein